MNGARCWVCDYCDAMMWGDAENENPPDGWISHLWPNGVRQEICTECTDELIAGTETFTQLARKNGWSKEERLAFAQAVNGDAVERFSKFIDSLDVDLES